VLRRFFYVTILSIFVTGIAVTVFSQLPSSAFDRMRRRDIFGLIPNWKFFAPIPATTDYEIFHRIQTLGDEWTDWQRSSPPAPRSIIHLVWFPGRRADKGIFDHVSELVQVISTERLAEVTQHPSYKIVHATVIMPINLL